MARMVSPVGAPVLRSVAGWNRTVPRRRAGGRTGRAPRGARRSSRAPSSRSPCRGWARRCGRSATRPVCRMRHRGTTSRRATICRRRCTALTRREGTPSRRRRRSLAVGKRSSRAIGCPRCGSAHPGWPPPGRGDGARWVGMPVRRRHVSGGAGRVRSGGLRPDGLAWSAAWSQEGSGLWPRSARPQTAVSGRLGRSGCFDHVADPPPTSGADEVRASRNRW